MIDDESLVKTRTNICLSYASVVPSYSVPQMTDTYPYDFRVRDFREADHAR